MSDAAAGTAVARKPWVKIPNGVKVRHKADGNEGVIEGLTEIVRGTRLNPDGLTQYRMSAKGAIMQLVAEDELLILTDLDGLVIMAKQQVEYRSYVTKRLRDALADDRFVADKQTAPVSKPKSRGKRG